MRVWFDSDDAYEDVEDWQEVDFYHAAGWMRQPAF